MPLSLTVNILYRENISTAIFAENLKLKSKGIIANVY